MTTFGVAQLYTPSNMGVTYDVEASGRNRWGDYSATMLDPLSNNFWTIQEFASSPNVWSTQVNEFSVAGNTPTPVSSLPGARLRQTK